MKIEVLGSGCTKCKVLEGNVSDAIAQAGITADVEKVSDFGKIMEYGVSSTPGLVIDGKVVSSGRMLSVEQIVELVKKTE